MDKLYTSNLHRFIDYGSSATNVCCGHIDMGQPSRGYKSVDVDAVDSNCQFNLFWKLIYYGGASASLVP